MQQRCTGGTAIILAGGSGSRMGGDCPKQYMMLGEYPVLYYSIAAFQNWDHVSEIVLVCAERYISFCRQEIVEKYGMNKVKIIVPGGSTRCESVERGLRYVSGDTVWVHDGARPFITLRMLDSMLDSVMEYGAVVAAVPAKDTIKSVDSEGKVCAEHRRAYLRQIQTPQVFPTAVLRKAYENMKKEGVLETEITDDSMLVGRYTDTAVYTVTGDYKNMKLTTPEDFAVARVYLKKYCLTEFEDMW